MQNRIWKAQHLTYCRPLDEKLTASVILQCPWIEKHTFEEFVKRLSISLEVYAIGVKASSGEKESKAANVKDLLDSSVIEDGSDIQIAVRDGSSDESEDEDSSDLEHKRISRTTTWLLWKTDLHICKITLPLNALLALTSGSAQSCSHTQPRCLPLSHCNP